MKSERGSILDYFPGTPRPVQREVLLDVERNWNKSDVIIIDAPVAAGKSRIGLTIQHWAGGGNYLVPSNILAKQISEDAPKLPTLHAISRYSCKDDRSQRTSCASRKKEAGTTCTGCVYTRALRKTKVVPYGIYNYWTYLAHKLYKPLLIVDEAHQLIPMLQSMAARKVWKHLAKWPDGMKTIADVLEWLETLPSKGKVLTKVEDEIKALKPSTTLQFTTDYYRGQQQEVLKLIPLDVSNEPPVMWPRKVKKIVLMSATISRKDIENMGLSERRVTYIKCKSPIPAKQRSVFLESTASMNYAAQAKSLPLIANRLQQLANEYKGQKGLVHVPYRIARELRRYLDSDNFMFHDRNNKAEVYNRFRTEEQGVLIASGLYEGVDLPDDLGRWQAIVKVPYQSLADAAVAARAREDNDYYRWEAIKTLLQASGRICRTPTDWGNTHILDSAFNRLYDENKSMFPDWFQEAVVTPKRKIDAWNW